MMKIDVVMITKNALSNSPMFPLVLKRIKDEIPLNKFILVDDSSDSTPEYVKNFFQDEILILKGENNRGRAREIGVRHVDTEYFAFIDDDVILCKDWFKRIMEIVDKMNDTGAIWGVAVPAEWSSFRYYCALSKLYNKSLLEFLIKQPKLKRFLMHDTLIYYEAVKNIRIPKNLNVFEDEYIGQYIISKGYKWVNTMKAYCLHYTRYRNYFKFGFETGFYGKLLKKYSVTDIIKILINLYPKTIYVSLFSYKAGINLFKNYLGLASGIIKAFLT